MRFVMSRRKQGRYNRPRSYFPERGRKGRGSWSEAFVVVSMASQEVPIRDCPEQLDWLPRSICNILQALGISKKLTGTDAANAVMSKLTTQIKPVVDLISRGVKNLYFFAREAVLCVQIVWNNRTELTMFGSTRDFFAV